MENIAKEFLLEEYKELNNTLHINEERGEKRLDLFITLSSFVIGVIGFAVKDLKSSEIDSNLLKLFYWIMILLITGLILVGLVILERLKSRNNITNSLIKDIKSIRELIKNSDDNCPLIVPYNYTAFEKPYNKSRKYKSVNTIAKIIIAVLLGLLSVFIVLITNKCTIQSFSQLSDLYKISFATFVVSAVILWFFKEEDKINEILVTRAGGVVFRRENRGIVFLIITSKENNNEWVLPKGHIEKNETPEFTAIREVIEETGILARPIKVIGKSNFYKGNESVNVIYFLMETIGDFKKPNENRNKKWLSKEEAIKELSFEEGKAILRKAQL